MQFVVIVVVIIASKWGHRKCNFPYPLAIKGYRENLDYGSADVYHTGWVTVFFRFSRSADIG